MKITKYNPPHNLQVTTTNIKYFLNQVRKHFYRLHKYHPIFNTNSISFQFKQSKIFPHSYPISTVKKCNSFQEFFNTWLDNYTNSTDLSTTNISAKTVYSVNVTTWSWPNFKQVYVCLCIHYRRWQKVVTPSGIF